MYFLKTNRQMYTTTYQLATVQNIKVIVCMSKIYIHTHTFNVFYMKVKIAIAYSDELRELNGIFL